MPLGYCLIALDFFSLYWGDCMGSGTG